MTAEEIAALNDQIAAMARAGLPLDAGLASLAREMGRGRLRDFMDAIAVDLRNGQTLPEALARRPNVVPEYYANLVTAGIRTGRLPDILATLTSYARTMATVRTIIADALFYPAVVFIVAIALLLLLMLFVMPQFQEIFQGFQMRLPWLTEAVLAVGRHPFLTLVAPILGLLTIGFTVWAICRRTEAGRRAWARLVYAVPIGGTMIRSARLAAFADLMAVMTEYDTPLPEAFRLAGSASADPLLRAECRAIAAGLSEGHPLGEVLRGRGLLPEWVAWMTQAGHDRGALPQSLRQIAELYRRQVESRAALLRATLPAIIIIITAGVLTSAFALAIMLPMIKLLEGLAK